MSDKYILFVSRADSVVDCGLLRRWWNKASSAWRCWEKRSFNRRSLAELEMQSLSDIPMSREQKQQEISKPFWRK